MVIVACVATLVVGAPGRVAKAGAIAEITGTTVTGVDNPHIVFLHAGQTVGATLNCVNATGFDPFLYAFAPDGSLVALDDDGGDQDCDGAWSSYLEFTAPVEGDYTFFAGDYFYRGGQPYSLMVFDGTGAGPGVPSGYVLLTMTCDMAVFDMPGGNPVGNNRVKSGQTFYTNPKTKLDANGESWTQIFVSSRIDPWVPSRCVN
ncbi:MAG TPA: hypothetical protein PLD47_16640 [Aggregatilineales bacterium]|nr:hypothetical protein [Anaerolineales bacterium]HRE49354.1 hypothetical protein [Aggregatilineales bacterium]